MKKMYFILWLISFLFLGSCTSKKPDCKITQLLLDEKLLPSDTYVEPIVSPIPDQPEESFAQGFLYKHDDISYMVTRWSSKNMANNEFTDFKKVAFVSDEYRGPWETPSEVYVRSETADNYFVSCGTVDGNYQCRMVATYREYLVYLRASISDDGIDISTLNELLLDIDKNFMKCNS